jgi:hypothetical protein
MYWQSGQWLQYPDLWPLLNIPVSSSISDLSPLAWAFLYMTDRIRKHVGTLRRSSHPSAAKIRAVTFHYRCALLRMALHGNSVYAESTNEVPGELVLANGEYDLKGLRSCRASAHLGSMGQASRPQKPY